MNLRRTQDSSIAQAFLLSSTDVHVALATKNFPVFVLSLAGLLTSILTMGAGGSVVKLDTSALVLTYSS